MQNEPQKPIAADFDGRRILVTGGTRGIGEAIVDSQDTLEFSELSGVRAMTEVFPLDRAAEAYNI